MSTARRRRLPVRRLEGHTASQRLEIARRVLAKVTRKQQRTKESDR